MRVAGSCGWPRQRGLADKRLGSVPSSGGLRPPPSPVREKGSRRPRHRGIQGGVRRQAYAATLAGRLWSG